MYMAFIHCEILLSQMQQPMCCNYVQLRAETAEERQQSNFQAIRWPPNVD